MFCLLLITTSRDTKVCGTICSSTKWEPKLFELFLFFILWLSSPAPHCQVISSTHPLPSGTHPAQPFPPIRLLLASPTSSCSSHGLRNSNQANSTHFHKMYFALYLFSVGHFINSNSRVAVPNPENTHFLSSKPQLASSKGLCVA